jgi:hypothetical protein
MAVIVEDDAQILALVFGRARAPHAFGSDSCGGRCHHRKRPTIDLLFTNVGLARAPGPSQRSVHDLPPVSDGMRALFAEQAELLPKSLYGRAALHCISSAKSTVTILSMAILGDP